jgi:hypothetical protein
MVRGMPPPVISRVEIYYIYLTAAVFQQACLNWMKWTEVEALKSKLVEGMIKEGDGVSGV